MSGRSHSTSLILLRWTVGLVVLWQSWQFAVSKGAVHQLGRMGLPRWTAPVLGGVEIFAAVLFLIPKLGRAGGYLLLAVFVLAAVIHVLHGQYEIGWLLVYSAAVFACVSAG